MRRGSKFGRWAALLILGAGAIVILRHLNVPSCFDVQERVRMLGWFAPWIYFGLAAILGILFVPRTFLILIAGMAFGAVGGTLLGITSAVASAAISFVLARYVAAEWVVSLLKKNPKVQQLGANIEQAGLNFILFTRFLHLPFSIMNYALALLPVRFRDYLIGSAIGLLPGTIVLAYVGQNLGCMILDGKAAIPPKTAMMLGLSMTMLAVLSLVPLWINQRKRKPKITSPSAIQRNDD